ncbi:anti-sigma factor RsbA family regulatory protein [Actinoplanes sp. NPDC049548]|uniref:anti-sigma factor RsbA family regulatory protein n=1 Tax=Actinoplanes sp. NPDC049548 TaxID=3155152 RepID=UPI00342A64BE
MVFTHSAFLYDTDAAYAATLCGFVRDGLERGEVVAVAAGPEGIGLLRDALAEHAGSVRFLPAHEWYVRPVRTIAGWAQILRSAAADGSPFVRLVGQIPFADPYDPWLRFESALNRSLAELNGHLVCPYDRRVLPTALVTTAIRTHPRLHDGDWHDSTGYESPETFLAGLPEAPWPVDGEPVLAVPIAGAVAGLRALVRQRATAEDWLSPDRVDSLVLTVSELATNGIRYGGTSRELCVWVTADAVVGEVTDDGAGPGPLAGYLPPRPGKPGGMGLWLVQQLCDSLTIHQGDGLNRVRFALRRS